MVEPSFAERTVINHKNYFKKGRVVTSPAINITETDVTTKDGAVIGYDYLVIATGHNDLLPKTRQEKLSQYQTGKDMNHHACQKLKTQARFCPGRILVKAK